MKTLERNGFYIPKEIFDMTDIDWSNKILLSEIYHILEHNKTCFASNKHFGELLGINKDAASKRITRLSEDGYITTFNKYENGRCIGRYIKFIGANTKASKKEKVEEKSTIKPDKSSSQKNHRVVPQEQGGGSETPTGILPEEHGGSSQTIRGVVPEPLGGSSDGNTNNITNKTKKNKPDNKTIEIKQLLKNVEEIIESSSLIPQSFYDNPVLLDKFKNAFELFSNKSKYPLKVLLDNMNYILKEYPTWKEDFLVIGYDKFMDRISNYHDGTPSEVAGILVSLIRILQHERSEDNVPN